MTAQLLTHKRAIFCSNSTVHAGNRRKQHSPWTHNNGFWYDFDNFRCTKLCRVNRRNVIREMWTEQLFQRQKPFQPGHLNRSFALPRASHRHAIIPPLKGVPIKKSVLIRLVVRLLNDAYSKEVLPDSTSVLGCNIWNEVKRQPFLCWQYLVVTLKWVSEKSEVAVWNLIRLAQDKVLKHFEKCAEPIKGVSFFRIRLCRASRHLKGIPDDDSNTFLRNTNPATQYHIPDDLQP